MSGKQSHDGHAQHGEPTTSLGHRTSGEAGSTPTHETMAETGGSGGPGLTRNTGLSRQDEEARARQAAGDSAMNATEGPTGAGPREPQGGVRSGGGRAAAGRDVSSSGGPAAGRRNVSGGGAPADSRHDVGSGAIKDSGARGFQDTRSRQAGPSDTGLGTPETGANQTPADLDRQRGADDESAD